jgi:hypothetical protein
MCCTVMIALPAIRTNFFPSVNYLTLLARFLNDAAERGWIGRSSDLGSGQFRQIKAVITPTSKRWPAHQPILKVG